MSAEAATSASQAPLAAGCIQLHLLDQTFRPEFTHQPFPGEIIRGYIPTLNKCDNDLSPREEESLRELAIDIQLAPSCRKCHVDINVRRPVRKRTLRSADSSSQKRSRTDPKNSVREALDEEEDEYLDEETEPLTDDSFEPSYSEEEEDTSNEDQKEGNTRQRRMQKSEIRERLLMTLPAIVEEQVDNDYLKKPYGCVLEEYECNGAHFCLSLAQGSQVAAYHQEVQRLALFFIETADCVDVSDQSQGSWKVLYLFQKHNRQQYSLAGYVTLYHFSAPFRKPDPGVVVRICQALILPPYQRAGHGQRMLMTLHKWADGDYSRMKNNMADASDIVEINIEDPAPAFTAMRNQVDYRRFLTAKSEYNGWFGDDCEANINDDDFFDLVKDSVATSAASKAKITTRQAQIVYEIDKLHCLNEYLEDAASEQRELLEKRYRLMVKKRLQKLHREDLSACRTKQEMQNLLATLYENVVRGYQRILDRISEPNKNRVKHTHTQAPRVRQSDDDDHQSRYKRRR